MKNIVSIKESNLSAISQCGLSETTFNGVINSVYYLYNNLYTRNISGVFNKIFSNSNVRKIVLLISVRIWTSSGRCNGLQNGKG